MGKIKKNSIILIGKDFFLNLLSIFVVGYIGRKLGVENYGKFYFSLSFAMIFSVIGNAGVRQYVTREIVRDIEHEKELFGQLLLARTVLALIMIIIGILTSLVLGHDIEVFFLVVIALISKLFFLYTTGNFVIFEAHEVMKYNALSQTISRLLVIVLSVLILYFGAGVIELAVVYLVGDIIQFYYSSHILRKNFFIPKIDWQFKPAFTLLKKSLPFALFSIFTLIYFRIGNIMTFELAGDAEAGLYQAAVELSLKALIISDAIGTAIFPRIVFLHKNNGKKYKQLTGKALILMLFLGLGVSVFLFLFSDFIINFIYRSQDYVPSIEIMKIFVWVLPIMFVTKILTFMLIARDRQDYLAKIYALIVLINIALNFIFIPKQGALGATYSMLIAEMVGLISFIVFFAKARSKTASIVGYKS